jgi:hypothetical protein
MNIINRMPFLIGVLVQPLNQRVRCGSQIDQASGASSSVGRLIVSVL